MKKVLFQAIFHNNSERLAICFDKDQALDGLVKKLPHAKWSSSDGCWHIPFTKQHCQIAYKALAPYATINIELLEKYLNRRKQITEIKQVTGQVAVIKPSTLQFYAISDDNMRELDKLVKTLQLKTYSRNTIELYRGELLILARLLVEKPLIDLTIPQIRAYILWLIKEQGYSESKIHTTINALKFYYEQVLLRPKHIHFNRACGQAAITEKGKRIYRIPNNGILLSQFKDKQGFVNQHYYLVDQNGNRILLPQLDVRNYNEEWTLEKTQKNHQETY